MRGNFHCLAPTPRTSSRETVMVAGVDIRSFDSLCAPLSDGFDVFAIGGVIDSAAPSSLSTPAAIGSRPSSTSRSSRVVTIRWEALGTLYGVSLPIHDGKSKENLELLGRDHREGRVRSFSADFSPNDDAIVDAVGRLLVTDDNAGPWTVRAQLSSLDVGQVSSRRV